MQTIKHNGKILKINAAQERVIQLVAEYSVMRVSDLAEGSGRRTRYACDIDFIPGRPLEITYAENVRKYPEFYPKSVRKFVADNPRVQRVVFDRRGKCKRMARKLDL